MAIGDRRGWLLLVLQVAGWTAFLLLALALIDGSRWILLFPLLLALVVLWLGQAVHAHQRAVELGSPAGGELQIAWLLPLVVAVVTIFWLIGGQHASPEATLQQYVAAWRSDRAAAGASLFREPPDDARLSAAWEAHDAHLAQRVAAAADLFGPFSGLDPTQPFSGLRFVELADERTAERAVFAIEITRRERIETMLFGILPTATQQTVVVERVGAVAVSAHEPPRPPWLPAGQLASRVWLIERVELPLGQPLAGRPLY